MAKFGLGVFGYKGDVVAGTNLATPEEAYFEFFRADSAKEAEAWAAVMSYPHVRVSAVGRVDYYETPAEYASYASRASWKAREATGWVRSRGIEPVRLQESDDKVHLAGGWTRFNADDEPILRNRVTYILTRIEGSWGIQARFGTDSFAEGESFDATGAVGVVERHLQDFVNGDLDAVVGAFEFPLVNVGVGRVVRHADAAGVRSALAAAPTPVAIEEVGAAQTGRDGVVVAARWLAEQEIRTSAVFLVARREDRWRIVGFSGMRG